MKNVWPTLLAGVKGHCPRCHRGRLFQGFYSLVRECPECQLSLAQDDSGDGPAVFLIFILGFVVVPPALWIAMNVTWPLWIHGVLWTLLITGLAVGLLRPAKGLTIALQYFFQGR